MDSADFVAQVNRRMEQLGVTQTELASACSLSQPHLSKVLSLQVKLADKTRRKLSEWLAVADSTADIKSLDVLRSLASRLELMKPGRRMQIMEFLRAVERLVET